MPLPVLLSIEHRAGWNVRWRRCVYALLLFSSMVRLVSFAPRPVAITWFLVALFYLLPGGRRKDEPARKRGAGDREGQVAGRRSVGLASSLSSSALPALAEVLR